MDYPLVIGQMLASGLSAAPDQRITYADQVEMTYAEFGQRVARLGSALASLGLGPGAVVAVMDYDSHRYLESFFAIPMLGATLHTVNVRLSPEQVLYTINHAEDDAILVHADFLPLLLPLLPRMRPVRLILLSDKPVPLPEGFAGEYEELLAEGDAAFPFPEFPETTRATLFYTTGTTGDPKGVTYTHRQLVLHSMGVIACLAPVPGRGGIKLDDVYMPLTPLFHVHGWGFPLIATMLGMRQVYPGRYEPVKLLRLIAEHGVTFSHCVPTILGMLLAAPESEAVNLTGWKVIIGGSALPEGLARQAVARGIDVHTGYGMSETCPILTIADMKATQGATGDTTAIRIATGKAAPLVQIRVVDPEMRDVPHDGVATGEVVARAPWLTHGYLRNEAGTAALWRGGWLHTGDVGNMGADGTLRITDRLKDVIKSGGEWISSLELESIVSAVPGVVEVAAVGVPDEQWGERPVVLVVAKTEVEAAAHAAVAAAIAAGRLSKWAAPERVMTVEAIPKTSVGKIDKKAIRASLAKAG
ncbi:long-chain-fatty-acid--CoA ligase [bacterium]|nr:long-chain-fatty-acid--CoA ligase [bacterium]